jgi:hypothetical protein
VGPQAIDWVTFRGTIQRIPELAYDHVIRVNQIFQVTRHKITGERGHPPQGAAQAHACSKPKIMHFFGATITISSLLTPRNPDPS